MYRVIMKPPFCYVAKTPLRVTTENQDASLHPPKKLNFTITTGTLSYYSMYYAYLNTEVGPVVMTNFSLTCNIKCIFVDPLRYFRLTVPLQSTFKVKAATLLRKKTLNLTNIDNYQKSIDVFKSTSNGQVYLD